MMNELKRVLYLSYTGMTDPLGQSQVLAYLKQLSQTGQYQFTIISFEKQEAYNSLRPVIEQLCKEAGITWHPLSYTAKPPVLSTFRDVSRMKETAMRLAKEHHYAIVHCRSYIASLVGLQLKRKLGIPFLFDMRGFWADERIDGGIWKKSNPVFNFIYRFFKKKEKQFLQKADQVVSLTNNAKTEIESWQLNPAAAPITVIPCCADFESFDPSRVSVTQKESAVKSLGIPQDAVIFSYLGTLGTWYMIDEMMAFAREFQKKNHDAYFLVMTGEPESMVRNAAKKAGYDEQFLRIKKVPRNEVPVYLSISSFSIFFIKPAFSKKASSPVKQGELMAMGVPIICNDKVGDTAAIINECKGGVVLNSFNEEGYSKAMEELKSRHFDRAQIRKNAEKYFLLSNGVNLYADVYKRMIK